MREKAKKLITASKDEQEKLYKQLRKIGLEVNSLADILGLDKKDYLDRRLQTIVVKKGLATTPKTARQMIVHKRILVDGSVVNIPSFVVPAKLENKISVKKKIKQEKKEE